MTEENAARQAEKVEVGRWAPDGTFTGEELRFTGEEAGSYTDYSEARSSDDRGITYTLYRTPDARYRVHVHEWSRWQGEDSSATLHPFEERGEDGVYGREPLAYATYTEEEARRAWPELFAAVGTPNVRDLDSLDEG
jgi:hypothetical protein